MMIPAVFWALSLGTVQVGPPAPPPPREKVSVDMGKAFAFEWDGKSVSGLTHPSEVKTIIFRYREPDDGPRHNVEIAMDVPPGETVTVPFADALRGVPAGPRDLDIRLQDEDGNLGNYSAPDLLIEVVVPPQRQGPSGVKGLRVVDDS